MNILDKLLVIAVKITVKIIKLINSIIIDSPFKPSSEIINKLNITVDKTAAFKPVLPIILFI